MEDLNRRQLNIQMDAARELESRIEALKGESRSNIKRSEYRIAKAVLPEFEALQRSIDAMRRKALQKVVGKIVRSEESYLRELLGVEYKNLDDYIAGPIVEQLLAGEWQKKKEGRGPQDLSPAILEKLREIKKFAEKPPAQLKEEFFTVCDYIEKKFGIEGEYYQALTQPAPALLPKVPRRVAVALFPLSAFEIASAALPILLSLLYVSRIDEENNVASRQDLGDRLGEKLYARVGWSYAYNARKLRGESLRNFLEEDWQVNLRWHAYLFDEVGQEIIDCAKEAGVIDGDDEAQSDKNLVKMTLSPHLFEKLRSAEMKELSNLSMFYKPMVVPPLDWKGMKGGGFLQGEGVDERFRLTLVRVKSRQEYRTLQKIEPPQALLEAVNRLQRVGYRINASMLGILQGYFDGMVKEGGKIDFHFYRIMREIFAQGLTKEPIKVVEEKIAALDRHYRRKGKISKKSAKRIRKALQKIQKARDKGLEIEEIETDFAIEYELAKYRASLETILGVAEEMAEYESFYFVWRLDFRGRIYPQQTLLHPQGGDLPKSLLLFAQEKPLGADGLKWLKIHGANLFGEVDKEPFDERIAWIDRHERQIVEAAREPSASRFWKRADDPLLFLAFCIEYARYLEDPSQFKTALPIAIDGSNNGFQHISTMLRDTEGARRVNVLPREENGRQVVSDIYADVAEELKKMLRQKVEAFEKSKDKKIEVGEYAMREGRPMRVVKIEEFVPDYLGEKIVVFLDHLSLEEKRAFPLVDRLSAEYRKEIITDLNLKGEEYALLEKWLKKMEKASKERLDEDSEDQEEDFDPKSLLEELKYELSHRTRAQERRIDKNRFRIEGPKLYRTKKRYEEIDEAFFEKLLASGIVDRSFVKKPVMTQSYGSSVEGKARSLQEYMEAKMLFVEVEHERRASLSLTIAQMIEAAIEKVTPSSTAYNAWMKQTAKKITKHQIPFPRDKAEEKEKVCFREFPLCQKIEGKTNAKSCHRRCAPAWKTPLGFWVVQHEFETEQKKITVSGDRKVTIRHYTDKLDAKKHRRGLAPNFVHSIDSTHLMMAVNRFVQEGYRDIVTIHDSFATHAGEVSALSRILRDTFVELHRKEILEDFAEQVRRIYGIEIEAPPYVDGEQFPFEEIERSLYMFG